MVGQTQSLTAGVGRMLVLIAALAGLFAMHGMSDHGMSGPGQWATTTSAHAPMPLSSMSEGLSAEPGDQSPSQPNHGHDMGAAGLCLAVLIAVLVLGVALGLWRRRTLSAWLPQACVGLSGAAREHVPKPPDLFALSILRC